MLGRLIPRPNASPEFRVSVAPFAGGTETALNIEGGVLGAFWVDSVTIVAYSLTPRGARLARIDVTSGATSASMELADSSVASFVALSDGFAWVPSTRDRIIRSIVEARATRSRNRSGSRA